MANLCEKYEKSLRLFCVFQGGLFEDIADGLRHAKLVLVCVSDEVGNGLLPFVYCSCWLILKRTYIYTLISDFNGLVI